MRYRSGLVTETASEGGWAVLFVEVASSVLGDIRCFVGICFLSCLGCPDFESFAFGEPRLF